MPLSFRHLTSTSQVQRADVDALFALCDEMEEVLLRGGDTRLQGKVMAALFYEPSTRTRLSFETAMLRLGGGVVSAEGIQFSSLYKGESIEDTIRMAHQYADVIVMRHPEAGTADKAAAVCQVPFLNAGDGAHDHPTQGLLDIYTIRKERGTTDDLHVALVGDLLNGRTLHSTTLLLSLFSRPRFTFISPPELSMPPEYLAHFDALGIAYTQTAAIEDGLDADVLYMTRVQKERFTDPAEYERLKDSFILTADMVRGRDVTVMHPLPRITEITTDVDALPNAAYFRQARNGLVMRMALLSALLEQ